MQFTLPGLKPTYVTEGLGGNSFNSTHLVRTYGLDRVDDKSLNANGIAELFSATDRYADKPMIGMTEAKGKKEYLTSNQYSWKLRGYMKQVARVTELLETSARPGENQLEFVVVLDKPWYKEPDVLMGEDNRFPLEIVGDPSVRGASWVYTLRIQTEDNSYYIPTSLLEVGREFRKVSTSIVDESNTKHGTMQFNSVFEVRSQTGNFGEKIEFTDKALRIDKNAGKDTITHWRVPFLDNNKKTYYNFMPMAEAEMMNAIYEDIEWSLMFGRQSTKTAYNGYVKRTGPGWRQQVEKGHRLFHNNNLTLAKLDQWLSSIYRGRKDASNRKIVLMTGEMGALMFDNMVSTQASSFLTVDSNFISNKEGVRHLAFGAQFTHYIGKNGLDVTVMLNPAYDNPDYCPAVHPIYTDSTIDSWRMDIMDFGATMANEMTTDNISMVCELYADYYYTTTGKWDPKTGMPINDGSEGKHGPMSGYATHIEKSAGLWVKDISRCGSIQLRIV